MDALRCSGGATLVVGGATVLLNFFLLLPCFIAFLLHDIAFKYFSFFLLLGPQSIKKKKKGLFFPPFLMFFFSSLPFSSLVPLNLCSL
jgi:hypothetical protein